MELTNVKMTYSCHNMTFNVRCHNMTLYQDNGEQNYRNPGRNLNLNGWFNTALIHLNNACAYCEYMDINFKTLREIAGIF
jgi:hypothetical protein